MFQLQLKLINSANSQIYSHDFELYQSSTVQSNSYAGAAPQFILCLKWTTLASFEPPFFLLVAPHKQIV